MKHRIAYIATLALLLTAGGNAAAAPGDGNTIVRNRVEKLGAIFLQFVPAHSTDRKQFVVIHGLLARHLRQ